jgi:Zn finger protein HypA/HybF involved in hydrogenase expression
MLIARCQSCGILYYGYALRYMPELSCPSCGSPLVIISSGNEVADRESGVNPKSSPESTSGIPTREP